MSQAEKLQKNAEQLTLFPVDSRAKTSRLPAIKKASARNGPASGQSYAELLAKYDLDSQLWKTSQTCLQESGDVGLAEYSETWPRSGMMQSGIAYRLPPLVPRTSVRGFSLWPTPDTQNHRDGGNLRKESRKSIARGANHGMSLHHAVFLFPTPMASDWKGPNFGNSGSASCRGLATLAAKTDGTDGGLNPTWVEWLMGFPLGWTDLDV